ncbi:unnamed protein product [Clonostachys chloroleuca]|uniref:Uncharacterized protein n=1 Tax=Clonostachys chloroleuca TaxID=1926264 RepID=A0AA35M6W5_9HYPO|nr:unnamed protein product [Clonostachys chloroleuca]
MTPSVKDTDMDMLLPRKNSSCIHEEVAAVGGPSGLAQGGLAFDRNFPEDRRKKILWKVEIRLIPLLILLYLFAYIDRVNIGNAKIEGLSRGLRMADHQYRICLSIFYVPYLLNHYLSKMSHPSRYIATIIVAWGIVMTMAGLVRNFGGLVTIRILLGAAGWSWIFILEGAFTVFLGVLTYLFLIDSPSQSSRWLEPDETRYLELRQRADPSRRAAQATKEGSTRSETMKAFWSVITDWQIWLHGIIYWSNTVPNNILKYTMPQIVRNMGFESTTAQLLTIPPCCVGAVSAFFLSWFADRFSWPINPCGNAWNLNNLAGPAKRAMGIAFMLCIGHLGGIIGGFIFVE